MFQIMFQLIVTANFIQCNGAFSGLFILPVANFQDNTRQWVKKEVVKHN